MKKDTICNEIPYIAFSEYMNFYRWKLTLKTPKNIASLKLFFLTGMSDKIRFITDRRIYVVGFGLYGSIHGPCEYQVTIQVKNFCFFWLTWSHALDLSSQFVIFGWSHNNNFLSLLRKPENPQADIFWGYLKISSFLQNAIGSYICLEL